MSFRKGLAHNPETFIQFSSLNLEPPSDLAEVRTTIELLKAKLKLYTKLAEEELSRRNGTVESNEPCAETVYSAHCPVIKIDPAVDSPPCTKSDLSLDLVLPNVLPLVPVIVVDEPHCCDTQGDIVQQNLSLSGDNATNTPPVQIITETLEPPGEMETLESPGETGTLEHPGKTERVDPPGETEMVEFPDKTELVELPVETETLKPPGGTDIQLNEFNDLTLRSVHADPSNQSVTNGFHKEDRDDPSGSLSSEKCVQPRKYSLDKEKRSPINT